MDQAEYEAYRRYHHRARRAIWSAVVSVSALVGFAIGILWSFALGFLVAASLTLVGLELHLRLDKARWIKRFPETADGPWRRRYGVPDRL